MEHEYSTVKYFLAQGQDVELIPPLQVKGMNTPDIQINGVTWEIKSPTGDGKHTMKHTIQNAKHQSRNVIVDLRRCGLVEDQAIRELEHHFNLSKRLRRMTIITNSENKLDYKK